MPKPTMVGPGRHGRVLRDSEVSGRRRPHPSLTVHRTPAPVSPLGGARSAAGSDPPVPWSFSCGRSRRLGSRPFPVRRFSVRRVRHRCTLGSRRRRTLPRAEARPPDGRAGWADGRDAGVAGRRGQRSAPPPTSMFRVGPSGVLLSHDKGYTLTLVTPSHPFCGNPGGLPPLPRTLRPGSRSQSYPVHCLGRS